MFPKSKAPLDWRGFLLANIIDVIGGAKGSRTPDLLNAIQALYQLSYGPT